MTANSHRHRWLLPLIILATLSALLAMGAYWDGRRVPAQPLTQEFVGKTLQFSYPEDWQYNIPQTNLLLLGAPEFFAIEPAPNVVIYRNLGLLSEDGLEAMLDIYLRRGPLHGDHDWDVGDRERTRLDDRPAISVILQGRDLAAIKSEELLVRITLTQAENQMVYIIATSVPVAQLPAHEATLASILASVKILE